MDEEALRARLIAVEGRQKETHLLATLVDRDVDGLRRDISEVRHDVKDVKVTLARQDQTLDEHTAILQEHSARFDSLDLQLKSLTQLVGQVLERLPEPDKK